MNHNYNKQIVKTLKYNNPKSYTNHVVEYNKMVIYQK